MRFDLEPGDTFCDGRSKLVTVKINDRERINLSTKLYYINDYQRLKIHDFREHLHSVGDNSFQGLQLKVEKVIGDYKLTLVSESDEPYYYYSSSTIATMDNTHKHYEIGNYNANFYEECNILHTSLKESKVLIDPKDIISSENISLILEKLESSNGRLKIQAGEEFTPKFPYKSVKLYDPSAHKMIGILNSFAPYFQQVSSGSRQEYQFHLYPFNESFENSYFTTTKLGSNYVGYISSENG